MDRCRTHIDYSISADLLVGFVRCVIHCVHMGRHGMAWHAAHLAGSVAFSQINNGNGNASFGKRESRKELADWIVCIDGCVLSLWFLSCSYFTSQHGTLCIMYASQPALLRCATLPSLLHVLVHASTLERPPPPRPPSAYIGTARVLRTP